MIQIIQDFSHQGILGSITSVCEPFPMSEDVHHQWEGISPQS